MWVDLVCHTEISRSARKNKYHILTHVCQIQKSGTEAPLCGAGTEKQVWRRGVCVQGEAGWDELGG